MRESTEQTLSRQWALLRCIPAWPRKVSVADLISAMGYRQFTVSRRTIERDLRALAQQFPLTADDSSKPYGWSWAKGARQEFAPRLSTSQGVALLLAHAHLKSFLPKAILNELKPVFDSAITEVAQTGWKRWHRETAVIPTSLALIAPPIDAGVLNDVHEALARKRRLTGRYRSKGADVAREVALNPLGLVVRGPVQYLIATMFDYTDVRQIALHRLASTSVLSEPRKSPPGFDFQQYVQGAGRYHSQGPVRLVAWFDPVAVEHLRETPLSLDQTIVPVGDGTLFEVSATVENDEPLRWWLLGFGSRVEVREPHDLRAEFSAHARQLAERYTA
ncbi:helix-turn-helix transcriptional regulator [Paraburkholderia pallida]|uniref:WYL domain-containing protein n=1 Tax=Paraburkholderia pallida TaxID=2547399 RepID=A0A4P7D6G7_9BURK|nr:WYL domain-containing protein [Paraburkholderia pallida]QBR04401.1 WYL domain-containing protein [Paraburkholderia pallida]